MTVDPTAWRGVATEKAEEVSAPLAALLRERSRRLLGDLLRPYRRAVIGTVSLIVVESLAVLAGPWLVGLAIDNGLPPLLHAHDAAPLLGLAAAFAVAVAVQAVTTRMFVTMTGRVGQRVVLELRRRLFAHCLDLDVAFHERYTSGRIISRQTSDIDSISDLFEEGLDSLIAAILTLLLVGTGMLLLDWQLALVVLAGFIPLTWLTTWFRKESASAYRRTREAIALVIVHFVETFGGIRAVQAFRREPQELGHLLRARAGLLRRERARLPADRGLRPLHHADRQHHHRCGARLRRPARDRPRHQGRRPRHLPAVPAALLRPAPGRVAVLQHVPVGGLRPGEDRRRPRAGPRGAGTRHARAAARPPGGPGGPGGPGRSGPRGRAPRPGGGCGSSRSPSPTATRSCCPAWTSTYRPARPSRWSARPARARRRSRACSAGSTTRARAG